MLQIFNPIVSEKILQKISSVRRLSLRRYKQGLSYNGKIPAGAYGVYFKKGSIGIKVVHGSFGALRVGGSKSLETLQRSKVWNDAIREYNILKRIELSGFTPIPYVVKPVQIGKIYFPAIFMEHIKGVPLSKFGRRDLTFQERVRLEGLISRYQKKLLTKYGVINYDAYGSNIIIEHKGNQILSLKIIDFSPEQVYIERR